MTWAGARQEHLIISGARPMALTNTRWFSHHLNIENMFHIALEQLRQLDHYDDDDEFSPVTMPVTSSAPPPLRDL